MSIAFVDIIVDSQAVWFRNHTVALNQTQDRWTSAERDAKIA